MRDGESLTERSGHGFHAWRHHVGVALQFAGDGLYFLDFFPGNNAEFNKGGILNQNRMSLAEQESVPARVIDFLRIEVHLGEIERRYDFSE